MKSFDFIKHGVSFWKFLDDAILARTDFKFFLACSSIFHQHSRCLKDVTKVLSCGHSMKAKCYEEENKFLCIFVVPWFPKNCDHENKRKCHVDESKLICNKPCEFNYTCGHKCIKKCGEAHVHTRWEIYT